MKLGLRIFGILLGILAANLPYCSINQDVCSGVVTGYGQVVEVIDAYAN